MKKGALAVFLAVSAGAWALEWELPVVTLKGEVAAGAAESDVEAGVLEPSSTRATVTLTVRESADPLALAWIVRWSAKEWPDQGGDYGYLEAVQEARLDAADWLRLSGTLGAKRMEREPPSSDWTALQAKLGVDLEVTRWLDAAAGLDARWEVHDDPAESRQRWAGSASLTARFGGWMLDASWRGEYRLPLAGATGVAASSLSTGSLSHRWDPNR
jgi:hypothetical protein